MTPNQLPPLPEPDTHCFDDDTGKDVWSYSADQMHAYALAALSQPAPSPQPAVPEWLNSAFPNCEDLQALGLKAPTPAQFAQQLHKRWKAKLEKVEEELCALKATHAPQPAAPVVSDERDTEIARLKAVISTLEEQQLRAVAAGLLRPAVEPMTPEQREVLAALVVGACEHKTRTLLALRAIEATEAQYGIGIGIKAKAEGGAKP